MWRIVEFVVGVGFLCLVMMMFWVMIFCDWWIMSVVFVMFVLIFVIVVVFILSR